MLTTSPPQRTHKDQHQPRRRHNTLVASLVALLPLCCDAFGPKLDSENEFFFGDDTASPPPNPTSGSPFVGDTPVCGDGERSEDEECDDGNALSQDGCSQTCELEPGYECGFAGRSCSSVCGDGIWTRQESCDDGNDADGDGCAQDCDEELGYDCERARGTCEVDCGDGIVAGQEVCDNRNQISGDGCSAQCDEVERGYACGGQLVTDDVFASLEAELAVRTASDAGAQLMDAGMPSEDASTATASREVPFELIDEPPGRGEVLILEERQFQRLGMTPRWTLRLAIVPEAETYPGGRCFRLTEI